MYRNNELQVQSNRPTALHNPAAALRVSLSVICRLACAVYLLHSLPTMLLPSGLVASILTLLLGTLIGLLGAAGMLVRDRIA